MAIRSKADFNTDYADPAGDFAINGVRAITAPIMQTFSGDIEDSFLGFVDDWGYYLQGVVASGTNTYTISAAYPAALTDGERFLVTFTNGNTGPCTLQRNALTVKDLVNPFGNALVSGQIPAGSKLIVAYNGTHYRIVDFGVGLISGTSPRIPYFATDTTLGTDSNFSWDNTNKAINLGAASRLFSLDKTYDDIFWGQGAGNFTTTGTGGNVGLGYNTLDALTTGNQNIALGTNAGGAITTATNVVAIGESALQTGTGITGSIGLGYRAGEISTGTNNVFIGLNAARLQTSGNSNICIGSNTALPSTTDNSQINVGGVYYGYNRGTTTQYAQIRADSANNGTAETALELYNDAATAPAAGHGVSLSFRCETGAGGGANYETIALIQAVTTDVTDTSEDADLVFKTMSGGAAATEAMRITSLANIYPGGTVATTMTDGFFYIPAAAGVPSGTPTSVSGHVPMYYDSTNNDFYVYNTAWKKVTLA